MNETLAVSDIGMLDISKIHAIQAFTFCSTEGFPLSPRLHIYISQDWCILCILFWIIAGNIDLNRGKQIKNNGQTIEH